MYAYIHRGRVDYRWAMLELLLKQYIFKIVHHIVPVYTVSIILVYDIIMLGTLRFYWSLCLWW